MSIETHILWLCSKSSYTHARLALSDTFYHLDARPSGKTKCIIYLEIIDLLLMSFQMDPSTILLL